MIFMDVSPNWHSWVSIYGRSDWKNDLTDFTNLVVNKEKRFVWGIKINLRGSNTDWN